MNHHHLARRLARVEERLSQRPSRRCPSCWERPPEAIVYEGYTPPGPPHGSPAPCVVCGWQPVVYLVRYVDAEDWRDPMATVGGL